MKQLFGVILLVMIGLSVLAWRLQPPPDGKLVWVSDDNPRRKEQIVLFEKEQKAGRLKVPGIPDSPAAGLKLDPNNGGLEKVIVQAMGGVGADLFDCYSANQLAAYVRSGVALDVTEELKKRGLSLDTTWKGVWPTAAYNGRVYGFPTNAAVNALCLNQDMFEKEGIPLPAKGPWTWDEFLPLAKRMTKRDASGRVVQYGFLADWYFLWPMCLLQWGGHYYTPDGTRCIIDSPEAIAGVQFAQDLIYKYRVMPNPIEETSLSGQGGWGQGTIKWFGANKGAMAIGGRWWLCTLRDQTHPAHGNPTLRMRVVELPHGPLRLFWAYGKSTLINAASPRAKEALDFLVYESRKPYNDLINEQADGVGPIKAFCETPEFMHDPAFPEEVDNDVWASVMKLGMPEEMSPFVDGMAVQRILDKQLDLVKSNQKSPADALHSAAEQIDEEIQKTLAQDPSLKKQYEELTRGH